MKLQKISWQMHQPTADPGQSGIGKAGAPVRGRDKDRSIEAGNGLPEKHLPKLSAIFRIDRGLIEWNRGNRIP